MKADLFGKITIDNLKNVRDTFLLVYLSYYLDPFRLETYNETVEEVKHVIDVSMYLNQPNDIIEVHKELAPFTPFSLKGLVEPGDIIGVLSDGVNSFKKNDASEVDWFDVVKQITEFKMMPGIFVQRQLGFLKRQWAKEGTTLAV